MPQPPGLIPSDDPLGDPLLRQEPDVPASQATAPPQEPVIQDKREKARQERLAVSQRAAAVKQQDLAGKDNVAGVAELRSPEAIREEAENQARIGQRAYAYFRDQYLPLSERDPAVQEAALQYVQLPGEDKAAFLSGLPKDVAERVKEHGEALGSLIEEARADPLKAGLIFRETASDPRLTELISHPRFMDVAPDVFRMAGNEEVATELETFKMVRDGAIAAQVMFGGEAAGQDVTNMTATAQVFLNEGQKILDEASRKSKASLINTSTVRGRTRGYLQAAPDAIHMPAPETVKDETYQGLSFVFAQHVMETAEGLGIEFSADDVRVPKDVREAHHLVQEVLPLAREVQARRLGPAAGYLAIRGPAVAAQHYHKLAALLRMAIENDANADENDTEIVGEMIDQLRSAGFAAEGRGDRSPFLTVGSKMFSVAMWTLEKIGRPFAAISEGLYGNSGSVRPVGLLFPDGLVFYDPLDAVAHSLRLMDAGAEYAAPEALIGLSERSRLLSITDAARESIVATYSSGQGVLSTSAGALETPLVAGAQAFRVGAAGFSQALRTAQDGVQGTLTFQEARTRLGKGAWLRYAKPVPIFGVTEKPTGGLDLSGAVSAIWNGDGHFIMERLAEEAVGNSADADLTWRIMGGGAALMADLMVNPYAALRTGTPVVAQVGAREQRLLEDMARLAPEVSRDLEGGLGAARASGVAATRAAAKEKIAEARKLEAAGKGKEAKAALNEARELRAQANEVAQGAVPENVLAGGRNVGEVYRFADGTVMSPEWAAVRRVLARTFGGGTRLDTGGGGAVADLILSELAMNPATALDDLFRGLANNEKFLDRLAARLKTSGLGTRVFQAGLETGGSAARVAERAEAWTILTERLDSVKALLQQAPVSFGYADDAAAYWGSAEVVERTARAQRGLYVGMLTRGGNAAQIGVPLTPVRRALARHIKDIDLSSIPVLRYAPKVYGALAQALPGSIVGTQTAVSGGIVGRIIPDTVRVPPTLREAVRRHMDARIPAIHAQASRVAIGGVTRESGEVLDRGRRSIVPFFVEAGGDRESVMAHFLDNPESRKLVNNYLKETLGNDAVLIPSSAEEMAALFDDIEFAVSNTVKQRDDLAQALVDAELMSPDEILDDYIEHFYGDAEAARTILRERPALAEVEKRSVRTPTDDIRVTGGPNTRSRTGPPTLEEAIRLGLKPEVDVALLTYTRWNQALYVEARARVLGIFAAEVGQPLARGGEVGVKLLQDVRDATGREAIGESLSVQYVEDMKAARRQRSLQARVLKGLRDPEFSRARRDLLQLGETLGIPAAKMLDPEAFIAAALESDTFLKMAASSRPSALDRVMDAGARKALMKRARDILAAKEVQRRAVRDLGLGARDEARLTAMMEDTFNTANRLLEEAVLGDLTAERAGQLLQEARELDAILGRSVRARTQRYRKASRTAEALEKRALPALEKRWAQVTRELEKWGYDIEAVRNARSIDELLPVRQGEPGTYVPPLKPRELEREFLRYEDARLELANQERKLKETGVLSDEVIPSRDQSIRIRTAKGQITRLKRRISELESAEKQSREARQAIREARKRMREWEARLREAEEEVARLKGAQSPEALKALERKREELIRRMEESEQKLRAAGYDTSRLGKVKRFFDLPRRREVERLKPPSLSPKRAFERWHRLRQAYADARMDLKVAQHAMIDEFGRLRELARRRTQVQGAAKNLAEQAKSASRGSRAALRKGATLERRGSRIAERREKALAKLMDAAERRANATRQMEMLLSSTTFRQAADGASRLAQSVAAQQGVLRNWVQTLAHESGASEATARMRALTPGTPRALAREIAKEQERAGLERTGPARKPTRLTRTRLRYHLPALEPEQLEEMRKIESLFSALGVDRKQLGALLWDVWKVTDITHVPIHELTEFIGSGSTRWARFTRFIFDPLAESTATGRRLPMRPRADTPGWAHVSEVLGLDASMTYAQASEQAISRLQHLTEAAINGNAKARKTLASLEPEALREVFAPQSVAHVAADVLRADGELREYFGVLATAKDSPLGRILGNTAVPVEMGLAMKTLMDERVFTSAEAATVALATRLVDIVFTVWKKSFLSSGTTAFKAAVTSFRGSLLFGRRNSIFDGVRSMMAMRMYHFFSPSAHKAFYRDFAEEGPPIVTATGLVDRAQFQRVWREQGGASSIRSRSDDLELTERVVNAARRERARARTLRELQAVEREATRESGLSVSPAAKLGGVAGLAVGALSGDPGLAAALGAAGIAAGGFLGTITGFHKAFTAMGKLATKAEWVVPFGEHAVERLENSFRGFVYWTLVKAGMDPADAVRATAQRMRDYADLGPGGRKFVQMVPFMFMNFTIQNTRAQWLRFLENPGPQVVLTQLAQRLGELSDFDPDNRTFWQNSANAVVAGGTSWYVADEITPAIEALSPVIGLIAGASQGRPVEGFTAGLGRMVSSNLSPFLSQARLTFGDKALPPALARRLYDSFGPFDAAGIRVQVNENGAVTGQISGVTRALLTLTGMEVSLTDAARVEGFLDEGHWAKAWAEALGFGRFYTNPTRFDVLESDLSDREREAARVIDYLNINGYNGRLMFDALGTDARTEAIMKMILSSYNKKNVQGELDNMRKLLNSLRNEKQAAAPSEVGAVQQQR